MFVFNFICQSKHYGMFAAYAVLVTDELLCDFLQIFVLLAQGIIFPLYLKLTQRCTMGRMSPPKGTIYYSSVGASAINRLAVLVLGCLEIQPHPLSPGWLCVFILCSLLSFLCPGWRWSDTPLQCWNRNMKNAPAIIGLCFAQVCVPACSFLSFCFSVWKSSLHKHLNVVFILRAFLIIFV